MNLTTEAQLADQFGLPVEKVVRLRNEKQWPHVRLGRFDVRYTDEQVAQIIAAQTVRPGKAPQASTALPGQTKRSAARRSA